VLLHGVYTNRIRGVVNGMPVFITLTAGYCNRWRAYDTMQFGLNNKQAGFVHLKAGAGIVYPVCVAAEAVPNNIKTLYSNVSAVCSCAFSCAVTGEKADSSKTANGRSQITCRCIAM